MTVVAAVVPMRHDSERVPGKNYRQLDGRPLFHHILQSLLASPLLGAVYVDTDSPIISADVEASFPSVRVLERPQNLRGGMISMNDVLLNDVQRIEADYYLQTHSTNPLLTTESITRAIDAFLEATADHDSLFSVTRLQARLWTPSGEPVNHDPSRLERTQDLAPLYVENSCLYIFSRASLEKNGSRIGERPMLYELPASEALDIDEEDDFHLVDSLVTLRTPR